MKTIEIKGTARTIAARSSEQARALKAIRKEGGVPCVLYGGKENVHFTVKNESLRKLVYSPDIFVVELLIDEKPYKAIMREIQFHPVKDNILHIDFYEIDDKKPIVMAVPVRLEGHAVGVKAGGKLQQFMRNIKVRATYDKIPEILTIDISELGLGKSKKISDLSFDGLEIVSPKSLVVCMVKTTRNANATAETAAPEEGAAAAAAPAPAENA